MYWYTDMRGQAAAKKFGKPILSLRLLGKARGVQLANSRFFRKSLFHSTISRNLRETSCCLEISAGAARHHRFWRRPQGERTLTGNHPYFLVEGRISKPCRTLWQRILRSLMVYAKVWRSC